MPLKELKIDHILAFQKLDLSFNDRINVLIGENGTGKTTALKMIYSATQASVRLGKEVRHLNDYFRNADSDFNQYINWNDGTRKGSYQVSDGNSSYMETYEDHHVKDLMDPEWAAVHIPSVFIPAEEMLSHANGFLALNQKCPMPFDATQLDIVMNASLPEAKHLPVYMNEVLEEISQAIDGTVVQENDTFYVIKKDGRKVEFSLEAEGFRKPGLLWKLIQNGLLEKGSVLLWDEPETNLNPELYELLVRILLILAENGVQIFVTTYSYNFAKYLEIRRKEKKEVSFISLYRNTDQQIEAQTAESLAELKPNPLMEAEEKLLNEVYNGISIGSAVKLSEKGHHL